MLLGAEKVILYTEQDVVQEVMQITDGVGVQVAYDGVGKSTFNASLASVKHRGWLVMYGNASGKVRSIPAFLQTTYIYVHVFKYTGSRPTMIL
jgi:NADPH:quinone reductase-like Zn-dependent oxidoreductase